MKPQINRHPRSSINIAAITLGILLIAMGQTALAHQEPPGCSANNMTVQIGVLANNVTNGTVVIWTVTIANPAVPTSCDVTLGPQRAFFVCPGPDGQPTGSRTNLIAGNTTLPPGYGPVTFNIPCVVNLSPGLRTAQGEVNVTGVVHKNPLQDDPADWSKSISVNVFQPCITVGNQCISAVNINGNAVVVGYRGSVTNCGNVLLQNVTVVSDQPSPNTVIFGPVTLAAGVSADFTATYTNT